MHIQEALTQALASSTRQGHQLCLMVDTAQAEGSHQKLDRWQIPYVSLFDETPEASLIEVAPLLIPVNDLRPDTQSRLFAWAEQLGYSTPSLSWFNTTAPVTDMAVHLRRLHLVGLSEGQSMLMRWYDTRILPVWWRCLKPQQLQSFTAKSMNWHYIDRVGGISSLTVEAHQTEFPPAPAFGQPLISLTDQQYGMLVDAADLDVLLHHLRRIIPDETRRVADRTLTEFVSRHQQAAMAAGLDDLDRQTQYVLLALYTSGDGFDQPAFKAFLAAPPEDLNAFHKGMQQLPDEVWEAGRPLWDAENSTDQIQEAMNG